MITDLSHIWDIWWVDKSDIRFVLDLSLSQISLNSIFRPVFITFEASTTPECGITIYCLNAPTSCYDWCVANRLWKSCSLKFWVYSLLTLITMIIIGHNSPFCCQTVPCSFRQLMTCHWVYLLTYILIAGRPRARDRAPYSWNMVNLFSLGCHVTDRAYVRTYVRVYRLYGYGRGDYQQEGRGVSGVLASPHLLYMTFTIWSIDSCQNRIATDQYPMTISRTHVWTHRGDVIYLEAVHWPVNCFTRSRPMFNLILLLVKLIMHTHIGHQCFDQAQVSTHRGQVCFWSYPLTSY